MKIRISTIHVMSGLLNLAVAEKYLRSVKVDDFERDTVAGRNPAPVEVGSFHRYS